MRGDFDITELDDMNYELAKKLKDAGFPQGRGNYFVTPTELWDETAQSDYETKSTPHRLMWVYSPTLEELIEACGGKFQCLMVGPGLGLWSARGNGVETRGDTPLEAVCNLWLELHKKHD